MKKEELRRVFLAKRRNLAPASLSILNGKIVDQFFDHFEIEKFKAIHVFLPILRNNEVNTWLIIKKISQEFPETKIIVSKSNFKTLEMSHYLYTEKMQFSESSIGIPEPINAAQYSGEFDMVLLPMLAFDLEGNRVGYGKGFYDRFLSISGINSLKVGLSFFEPIDKIEDKNEFDVKMDFCLTGERVYGF